VQESIGLAVLRGLGVRDGLSRNFEPRARQVDGVLHGQPRSRGNHFTGPKGFALHGVQRFVHLEVPGDLIPAHSLKVSSAADPARQIDWLADKRPLYMNVAGTVAHLAFGRFHGYRIPNSGPNVKGISNKFWKFIALA